MKKLLLILVVFAGVAYGQTGCVTSPFATTANLLLPLPAYNQCNWGSQGYNVGMGRIDALFPSGVLAKASGGNGTATPALIAGTNITITGSWPNYTINSTGGGAVTSVFGMTGAIANLSGDVSTSGSSVTTLLTVNSNVGSFTSANITVDAKGRVTAAANGTAGGSNTTYFVSNSGSDAANGTSESTPWQTVAKVNSVTFNPGDSVLFLRGGTWREQLTPSSSGTSISPITFGAYGAGASPAISGADILGSWTFATPAYYSASASVVPGSVIVDGNYRLTKNTTSIVSLTAGQWFWDSGTSRVYVRLLGDSAPSGHVVEGTQRQFAVRNTKNWVNFSNLAIYGTVNVGHYENSSTNTVITGESANWNDVNGMLLRGGYVTCTNCVGSYNKVHGIATDDAGSGSHDIILNNPTTQFNIDSGVQITDTVNVTINGGDSSFNGSATVEGNGVSVSSLSGVAATNILVNDFHAHDNLGNGFSSVGDNTPTGATGIVITRGVWCNNLTGLDPSSGVRLDTRTTLSTVQYVIACNNTSGGIVSEDNSNNNRFLYNVVYGNNDGLAQTNGTGTGNVWYGNVSYGNTNAGFVHQTLAPGSATIKNNILVNNVYGYFTDGGGVADTVDYNDVFGNGTNYHGISAPTHDIQLDPLFVNAGAGNFNLQTSSPAIGAGVALGSPFNLGIGANTYPFIPVDQNFYGAAWEMGPFVYSSPAPPQSFGNTAAVPFLESLGTTALPAYSAQLFPHSGLYWADTAENPMITVSTAVTPGSGFGLQGNGPRFFVGLPGSYYSLSYLISDAGNAFKLRGTGCFGFPASSDASAAQDTCMSRSAAGVLSADTTTIGDGLGTFQAGKFNAKGSSSGIVSILPAAAAGTYNFNLPITAGSTGQTLTSQGGGSTAMTWSTTPVTICSGTIALGTSAIGSGAAATTVTQACSGLLTTDNITLDFNASPLAVTGYTPSASGMLTIIKWPTSGQINVSVVNNTGGSITPGAITLNYHVTR